MQLRVRSLVAAAAAAAAERAVGAEVAGVVVGVVERLGLRRAAVGEQRVTRPPRVAAKVGASAATSGQPLRRRHVEIAAVFRGRVPTTLGRWTAQTPVRSIAVSPACAASSCARRAGAPYRATNIDHAATNDLPTGAVRLQPLEAEREDRREVGLHLGGVERGEDDAEEAARVGVGRLGGEQLLEDAEDALEPLEHLRKDGEAVSGATEEAAEAAAAVRWWWRVAGRSEGPRSIDHSVQKEAVQ